MVYSLELHSSCWKDSLHAIPEKIALSYPII